MSPGVLKRSATSAAAGRPNKRRMNNEVMKQCSSVGSALRQAPGFTAEVQSMLVGLVPTSLGVHKEIRHSLQHRAVEMIEEALASMEAHLKGRVEEAKVPVDRAATDKSERAADLREAEANLAEFSAKVAEAREAVSASNESMKAAKATVSASKSAQEEGDAVSNQSLGKKLRLEEAFQHIFGAIKEKGLAQKADVRLLTKIGKDFDFDASLIASMAPALEKEAATRGPFDVVILEKLEAELSAAIDREASLIREQEPGRAERATAVAHAQAELAAAADAHELAKTSLAAAISEEKCGRGKLKAAQNAVTRYMADMKARMDAFDEAQRSLAEFIDGPLGAFATLKELAPHVEVGKENVEAGAGEERANLDKVSAEKEEQPRVSVASVAGA